MKNKRIKGIVNSAMALSLAFVSLSSLAGSPSAPTDINFGLPVNIVAGHDLIEVVGPGDFGTNTGLIGAGTAPIPVDVSGVFDAGLNMYGFNHAGLNRFNVGSSFINVGGGISGSFFPPSLLSTLSNWNGTSFFVPHTGVWAPGGATSITAGGNSTGSGNIYYHVDPINNIVTITYDDVPCSTGGSPCTAGVGDAVQARFHSIGAGNFVVEYRFENVSWGNGENVGWTSGDGINFGSNSPADFLTESNINHPGVFAYKFINGAISPAVSNSILEGSANGVRIGSLNSVGGDAGNTYTMLDDAGGRFVLMVDGGVTYVVVLNGGDRLDVDDNETHNITVRVTDSALQVFDKVLVVNVIRVPEFSKETNIIVELDESMNVTVGTRVEQGTAPPTITATGIPAWMRFSDNGDGTATLAGFPSFELTFQITLTVTDALGNVTTRTFNIKVAPTVSNNINGDTGSGNTETTTTVEVTVTNEDGSASSFGWLLLLIGGGLFARKRLK